jgi:hypothetical protein
MKTFNGFICKTLEFEALNISGPFLCEIAGQGNAHIGTSTQNVNYICLLEMNNIKSGFREYWWAR